MSQPRPPSADEFETSDLGVAAFLAAKDYPVLRVEMGQRSTFVFPAGAEPTARLFYLPGSNLVDARRFHTMLRELRGLARGGQR
jgi:hypothetical protein